MNKLVSLGLVSTLFLSGCAANLSSGKLFQGIENPPAEKATIIALRDENYLAAKLPYIAFKVAKSDGKGKPAENYELKALVGKDQFVSIMMDPGTYVFKTGYATEFTIKPGETRCLEIGGKYRGVTVWNIEEIESKDECKKALTGKEEGVQLAEALKRTGRVKE